MRPSSSRGNKCLLSSHIDLFAFYYVEVLHVFYVCFGILSFLNATMLHVFSACFGNV